MDENTRNLNKKYDRVMPRVYNRPRSSLKSASFVTRHETHGGKQSVSNVTSSVFSDLPVVLKDYKMDSFPVKPLKRTSVVKPRRTLKSLDPALSPPRSVRRSQELRQKPRNMRVKGSAPSVLTHGDEKWPESHITQCYSSKSHAKLKDLKDEIKAYQDTEKLMRLRSQLYKSCGVVLDDTGQVAVDKAVQVEAVETEKTIKTKWKNMRAYFFKQLRNIEKQNRENGNDGVDQITSSSWPLFNQLMFLKDITDKDRSDEFDTNYQEYEYREEDSNGIETIIYQPVSSPSSDHIQDLPRKKRRPSTSLQQHNELLSQLERQKVEVHKDDESDTDLLFLQSLVPFMKEFPLRHKLRLRSKIQDLILGELESIDSSQPGSIAVGAQQSPGAHVTRGGPVSSQQETIQQQSRSCQTFFIKEEFYSD